MANVQLFGEEYTRLTRIVQELNARTHAGYSLGSLSEVRFGNGVAHVPLQGISNVQWGALLDFFRQYYPEADITQKSHTKFSDDVTLLIAFPREHSARGASDGWSACGSLRRCFCCCFYLGLREWCILVALCAIGYYYLVERAIGEHVFDGSLRSWGEYGLEAVYQIFFSNAKISVSHHADDATT